MPVEGEAAVEAGDGLPEEREAAEEEGDGLAEEEAAVEEGDGLPEEREALEEATGAFLVEEAGCLERLLEEKRESMLAKVQAVRKLETRWQRSRSDFADFSNFGFADFLSSDFTTIKMVRPSVIIFTVSHGPSNK